MNIVNIIWDFDGTILPIAPYDSEQSLMQYKLNLQNERISLFTRLLARFLNYADNREMLTSAFKRFYGWFMKETHVSVLDTVCELLAEKISDEDRQALLQLKSGGYRMAVLSCGTADLSERVLRKAHIDSCFEFIAGNRFKIDNHHITGMKLSMNKPESKVDYLNDIGMDADSTVAVGDGYTDIPMLDWSRFPVVMDRSGHKKDRFAEKDYSYISSIPELLPLIKNRTSNKTGF